jgi:DNA-binding Lrp family transcriptional regulator
VINSTKHIPLSLADPVNARILAESEDKISGFQRDPIGRIAAQAGLPRELVAARLLALLQGGTIRRIRQTLLATNLAHGALVAWRIDTDLVNDAFDYLFQRDPFSGHVVIRSTDAQTPGHAYRLWTTVKVPDGYSLPKHCTLLQTLVAKSMGRSESPPPLQNFLIMPAKRLFALGVGHIRRRKLEIGSKADVPAEAMTPELVSLSELDWRVLVELKREFTVPELAAAEARAAQFSAAAPSFWLDRATAAGVDLETFCSVGESLNARGVIGRFSTFLEHVKPLADGERVTRFNGLFHWAVRPTSLGTTGPAGPGGEPIEIAAGRQIGRFHIMTHCYWREGGPEFANVNLMGVAHGTDQAVLLAHKHAIDEHLAACGIPVTYTNVFWGGRSEIKPSEIVPQAYAAWCRSVGVDPETMKA